MTTAVEAAVARLGEVLADVGDRVVACSGGVDSITLATVAHLHDPDATVVAHTVTPAVPAADTARVVRAAGDRGWRLELVRSDEFDDERYLANPTDRCYFCKTHLYDALNDLAARSDGATVLSGANTDDLGEYRPGLTAAGEHGVRHPYLEAGLAKADVRAVARHLDLDVAEVPASPCLASRLYTGTRVTPSRLRAVELGEAVVRGVGVDVVRCRVRDHEVIVEVAAEDRERVTPAVLDVVAGTMRSVEPSLGPVTLDDAPYRPGRAVLPVA